MKNSSEFGAIKWVWVLGYPSLAWHLQFLPFHVYFDLFSESAIDNSLGFGAFKWVLLLGYPSLALHL